MFNRICRYFNAQIQEIYSDSALRLYGVCLALGNFFAFGNWMENSQFINFAKTGEPFCWPFWENCFQYRFLDIHQAMGIFVLFGLVSAVGVFIFIPKKFCPAAYWWLITANFLKTLIFVQDFRFRMNQHYILYFVTIVFLFLPNKRNLLRYLLVFVYFWAGTLKFNYEWISGAALYALPMFVQWPMVREACIYVIFLECLIVWGILSKNKWIFWGTFFQLFLFHFCSWRTVGSFYPLLMYFLITIFPLAYVSEMTKPGPSLLMRLISRKEPLSTYLFLGLFSVMNLVPIVMPGDEKITGEGRLFALHMFDAQVFCEGSLTLKFRDGKTKKVNIPLPQTTRIQCDPVVSFSRAKRHCWEHRNDLNFIDLDFYYKARRNHETAMRPLVDVENFCSKNLSYDLWRTNDWIKK